MTEAAWKSMQESLPRPMVVPQEYGFVRGSQVQGCTLEALRTYIRAEKHPALVWTPDSPALQVPEEVPALFEEVKYRLGRTARENAILWLIASLPLLLLSAMVSDPDARPLLRFFACLFGLYAVWHLHGFLEARSLTPEKLAAKAPNRWHGQWLQLQRPIITPLLVACISAVGIFQLFSPDKGIPAAGLVKDLTRHGEWWRLITATVLHVNPTHFLMNVSGLLALGRIVEAHFARRWLPLTFALTAPCGSLLSVALLSETSVGASGGILGIIGLLTALGYRAKSQFPPDFFRAMVLSIVLTALIGTLGFDFIDNAAHAGGLLAGLLLGSLLPLSWLSAPSPSRRESPWLDRLALVPVIGFALAAIAAILAGS